MGYFTCRAPATDGVRTLLEALDLQGKIAFDHFHEADGQLVFSMTSDEIEVARSHGIDPEITENLEAVAAARLAERASLGEDDSDDALSTGFVDQYMDAAEVSGRIDDLAAAFPALCHLSLLPEMTQGYDGSVAALAGPSAVQLLRLTDDPSDRGRPALLLICGTHAREWVNPLIAVEFAEQLVRNFDPTSADPDVVTITRILQEGEVLIVPVMNPDGLNYSIHDSVGWRKNRRPNPGSPSCPGVDNNRNYEVFFGEAGSASLECSSTYRGGFAFSEPENRNLRFIAENHPNIVIAVDSHSQGEKIFRPTASGGSYISALPVPPEDETIYQTLEAAANAAIQSVSGKTYITGTTSNHAGTSDEYFFFAHRAFGFDFECALSHQPPIDSALVSVQEVTAALRALATKAIDLEVATTVPARMVQAIDRTGSMAAFGYDDDAQANAKRLVDLMSMGDSVGIVSFADPSPVPDATPLEDRARVDMALGEVTPASVIQAHDEIDDLVFGGWTSLGAGLAAAAGELAGSPSDRSAIVLLSDGFENRAPWTSHVLSTFPSDLPVHTVALGGASDIPTLENIATETGGTFHLSPTSFELYEIYNQIRADSSDDDLVLNQVIENGNQGSDDDADDTQGFQVEHGASQLLVSLSWPDARAKTDLTLVDPHGRRLRQGDWGFEKSGRPGHLMLRVLRPVPGRWHAAVVGRGRLVLGAFVRSPLRVACRPEVHWDKRRRSIALAVRACSDFPGGLELRGEGLLTRIAEWRDPPPRRSVEWLDAAGADVRARCDRLQPTTGDRSFRAKAHLDHVPVSVTPANGKPPHTTECENMMRFERPVPPGVYQVDLRLAGTFSARCPFERVMRITAVVAP